TVTDIRSEEASDNSVPDLCRIRIDRRFCPQETEDELIAEIRRIAGENDCKIKVPIYRQKSHTGVLMEGKKYFPGWLVDEEDPLVIAARKTTAVTRGKQSPVGTWRFSTNGVSTMGRHGIPTIGFGPGREEMAHRPNERVRISDLTAAHLFYAHLPGIYLEELSFATE
ncbi:MAG TPA: M20/M25/M40 family metallo-hydrolase, partial [Proteobacteria bacterium]|nr:M20/M25/M40 family metallo-hydrolase [Pseudomonadota bacterium]